MLEIPDDYLIGIVPASDTGAVEMAIGLIGRDWIHNSEDSFALARYISK